MSGTSEGAVAPSEGRVPQLYVLCLACHRHVRPATVCCPHCGADVQALLDHEVQQLEKIQRLASALQKLVEAEPAPLRPAPKKKRKQPAAKGRAAKQAPARNPAAPVKAKVKASAKARRKSARGPRGRRR